MRTELRTLAAAGPLVRKNAAAVAGVLVLGFAGALLEGVGISLFIPFLQSAGPDGHSSMVGGWLGDALDRVVALVPEPNRLRIIALVIFGLIVVRGLLSYAAMALSETLDARMGHELRSRVFRKYAHAGLGFLEKQEVGKLMNTLDGQTATLAGLVSTFIGVFVTVGTILVYGVLLVLISWRLTLLVLAALTVISLVVHRMTKAVEGLSHEAVRSEQSFLQRALETLRGMRTVRAFGREKYEQRRFDAASLRLNRTLLRMELRGGLIQPTSEILAGALLVAVLFIMLQDPGSLPAVLTFIFILYRLHPQVLTLDGERVELLEASAPVGEILAMLEAPEESRAGTDLPHGVRDAIRFENVSFRYAESDPAALRDVSFSMPAGKTTALVGPSGSGKSTVINLILRFYEPTTGTVRIDDTSLADLDVGAWRDSVAVVAQDAYVFNATIRENISYGRLEATQAEIETAARHADAHDFIAGLPNGYDTVVGEQGVRLSGGQRQRIGLARAIVRDPRILILDEATNALDSLSENAIRESVQQLGEGRTVIIIAHRLSTIEWADRILVLEAGRVVEEGSFQHLLENEALFAKLHALQTRSMI